ncbi:MAG: serine/threonine protein kinase [Planctomycetes bacterium]|nr:serine/threonine protein kinase [Planctomycetota bacterium]
MTAGTSKPSSSSFSGDFAPGEILIGRYRVIALVGEGGMGQVYLADDLVLGQPVALKFLPAHLAEREGGLERFRAEVRHAREVTHPNVARVHDIGEVGGRHFLTMEFVDGEDLASLIKRIGRLPREKAAEIAQQICSGLAEAHRKGVLHRDLKPANVMLDGEGRVKLTDFGLAVTAASGGDDGGLAGTPAYMAPEQLAGLPASERSEVYSLGLVLYELYTGRRALRGRTLDELRREHEQGPPSSASSVFSDIDPLVESMLARCLQRDPKERPASVREVARGLPGGDPLAAALAQGHTPAPELVAAADAGGALSPRAGLALAVGFVVLFVALALARTWYLDREGYAIDKAPAVLDERARELVAELTGREAPSFAVSWYAVDYELVTGSHPANGSPTLDVQPLMRVARFAPEPFRPHGVALAMDDPDLASGGVDMCQDTHGRLVSWTWRPDVLPGDDAPAAVDWARLFTLAGVDPSAVESVEPDFVPRVLADESRAWTLPGGRWRLQGAAYGGRPVQFDIIRVGEGHSDASGGRSAEGRSNARDEGGAADSSDAPDEVAADGADARGEGDAEDRSDDRGSGSKDHRVGWMPTTRDGSDIVFFGLLAAAVVVAWRNVRSKRGYLAGALGLAGFEAAVHILAVLTYPVPTDPIGFVASLNQGLAIALHTALRVFVFFLALEPFARRRWPGALISWTRLLQGRVRDPSVAREVLVGLFTGQAVPALVIGIGMVLDVAGVKELDGFFGPNSDRTLEGPLQAACHLVHGLGDAIMLVGTGLFVLVALRALVRLPWLGNGLWVLLLGGLMTGGRFDDVMAVVGTTAILLVFLTLLTRFGFVAVVAFWFMLNVTGGLPATLRPGDPAFGTGVFCLLVFAGLVTWACRTAVGPRSAFA